MKDDDISVLYLASKDHPADKLTKLGDRPSHAVFVRSIMGHALLDMLANQHEQPDPVYTDSLIVLASTKDDT